MTVEKLQNLVSKELNEVNNLILEAISTEISLTNDVSEHIISAGGKKIRPLIVILGAKCFGYNGRSAIHLAAALEFFHTSSLLHDDVIDNSDLRRGKKTAHTIWGSKSSVLVGDYLFSKAFQLMLETKDLEVLKVLSHASNVITQGEVKQLLYINNANITKEDYMDIIRDKTATLFEAAARVGAMLAKKSSEEINAMKKFGLHLGNAFQMIDDIFDYKSNPKDIGKNIGNDLKEGKVTLPLIHAMEKAPVKQSKKIKEAITSNNKESISKMQDEVLQLINDTDAITYTQLQAEHEIDKAVTYLLTIEESKYRDSLEDLAHIILERTN